MTDAKRPDVERYVKEEKRMRSDNVKAGVQQAPHRSLFNALGFTQEEMKKPMVGIVSSYNEIVPGHMNLDKIVDAVRLGVAEAGGVPVVFRRLRSAMVLPWDTSA